MKFIGEHNMNYTSVLIALALSLASVGSAQVVLPASSDYNDPYTYYRDCVDRNGEENRSLCENHTGTLFPEEDKAPVEADDDYASAETVNSSY
ncbi:hypothetical protein EBR03_03875 [bacterium]|nr:hypothetical protein [bacterium]